MDFKSLKQKIARVGMHSSEDIQSLYWVWLQGVPHRVDIPHRVGSTSSWVHGLWKTELIWVT